MDKADSAIRSVPELGWAALAAGIVAHAQMRLSSPSCVCDTTRVREIGPREHAARGGHKRARHLHAFTGNEATGGRSR